MKISFTTYSSPHLKKTQNYSGQLHKNNQVKMGSAGSNQTQLTHTKNGTPLKYPGKSNGYYDGMATDYRTIAVALAPNGNFDTTEDSAKNFITAHIAKLQRES